MSDSGLENVRHFLKSWVMRFLTGIRSKPIILRLSLELDKGWYPELVFLTVVFFNSTDLAVVIPNSTVKRYLFYSTTSQKPCQRFISLSLFGRMHNLTHFLREALKK